jgi:hypothetical protein
MSWPPRQPRRDEIAPEDLGAYERVLERRRAFSPATDPEADGGYYGRLLLSPRLAAALSDLGGLVRAGGAGPDSYTHAQREFADQVLSKHLATNVVQTLHVPDALSAGVRREAIDALRSGDESHLNADEQLLAAFIRALVDGRMTRSLWEAVEATMGDRGVVEYAIFVLFLQLTMRLQQAVGQPDPSDDEIDGLLARIDSGQLPLPDHARRIR